MLQLVYQVYIICFSERDKTKKQSDGISRRFFHMWSQQANRLSVISLDAFCRAGIYFKRREGSDIPIRPLKDRDAIIVPSPSLTGTAIQLPLIEDS